ncbi:MAG: indolepyruvate oxidoreductase subunit beta [Succinivibrio sp.]
MNRNILICGVGGQGTVLASKLTASAAMEEGYTVRSAETIGMAQRGGSVTSHIRIGQNIYSPLIPLGQADLILGFEPAEAVRNLSYLKKGGLVIVNRRAIRPVTSSLDDSGYDGESMIAFLKKARIRSCVVDSDDICRQLGSVKSFNVVMLGVACALEALCVSDTTMQSQLLKKVKKPQFIEMNKKAFSLGMRIGKEYAAK